MRILRIRIANLNSIPEADIRLDRAPIADSGLFAITGATGSGKSTILDAITLALYGDTPRGTERDILSQGAGECYAEVEFERQQQRYRSKWSIRRARGRADGNLQPPQMELCELPSGNIIESGKRDVPKRVEMITELDFDRFKRSMLLAQGDFAAFLSMKGGERSEILERITGTLIYGQISTAAYERCEIEEAKVTTLTERITHLELLSEEEIEALQTRQQDIVGQRTTKTLSLQSLRQQLQAHHDYKAALTQLDEVQATIQLHQRAVEDFSSDAMRLDAHNRAKPYEAHLHRLDEAMARLARYRSEQEELHRQITQLQIEKSNHTDALAAARSSYAVARDEQQQMQPILEEVITLDARLATERERLAEAEKQEKTTVLKHREASEQLDNLRKTHQETQQRVAQQRTWLQEHRADEAIAAERSGLEESLGQLDANRKSHASLRATLTTLREATANLEPRRTAIAQQREALTAQLDALISTYADTTGSPHLEAITEWLAMSDRRLDEVRHRRDRLREATQLHDRLQEQRKVTATHAEEQEELQTRITKRTAELTEAKANHEAAEKDYRYAYDNLTLRQRTADLSEHRSQLTDDKPCPLCGSVHHPYATDDPTGEGQLERAQQEHAAADALRKAAEQRVLRLATEQQHDRAAHIKSVAALEASQAQAIQLECALDPLLGDVLPDQLPAALKSVDESLDYAAQQRKTALTIQRDYADHLEKTRQLDALNAELDRDETAYNTDLEHTSRQVKQVSDTIDRLTQQLTARLQLFGLTPDSERILAVLRTRDAFYRQQHTELQAAEQQATRLQDRIGTLTEQLQELKNQVQHHDTTRRTLAASVAALMAQRSALFGDRMVADVRAELVKAVEQTEQQIKAAERTLNDIAQRHTAATTQLDQVTRQLTEAKMQHDTALHSLDGQDLPTLRAQLLDADTAADLMDKTQALRDRDIALAQQLEDRQRTLDTAALALPESSDAAQLEAVVATLDTECEQLQLQLGEIKQQLSEQERRAAQSQQLMADIVAQKRTTIRWQRLKDLIGSRDGNKFRRFAQGQTLRQLVQLANRHLARLNDRYVLRQQYQQDKPEQALEITIIDRYQGDHERKVNTLSGGETFLVSMALALGLSDLASDRVRIDTLFIDEGFGTLDQETLATAMQTLESLQHTGKVIGIISHVPALQEAITTQVRVQKQGSGRSTVEVHSVV